jgi:ABC-2 type transport system ATP-binding protein
MPVIEVDGLTRDYGHGRGVFDINAHVEKGECLGFLGPNGAGKSTTIRHMMGFSKPQKGRVSISGHDTWKDAAFLQRNIGYLPGEIALPSGMTGRGFLKMQMELRKISDESYIKKLLDIFELDPDIALKQMSLGTRRKLAVVTAFLHDPEILILDEPTSGLDPIMQNSFINFLQNEKRRGKTIFLSSHIFMEVYACCDRIAIIKDGRIVSEFNPEQLKNRADKIYRISFAGKNDMIAFCALNYDILHAENDRFRVKVQIRQNSIENFLSDITKYKIKDFKEIPFSLEDYFMQFYKEDMKFEGVKNE